MIVAVLNFLGVPHEEGFFAKDLEAKPYLTEGWQARVLRTSSRTSIRPSLLLFYINHLALELGGAQQAFLPAALAAWTSTCSESPQLNWWPAPSRASTLRRPAEELEAVRVEVLGRKGVLAQLSKDMGKLSAGRARRAGKFINAAKQALEARLREAKARFETPP